MRFAPSLLDEIRARLPVSQVVGKHVKLRRQGREFVGLSPFKQEKTPSFTVNDQKGFYHCFASGHHGDIFRFLTDVQGLSFFEAVEQLAAEAGVHLPAPSPEAERKELDFEQLRGAMEAAAKFFELRLTQSDGAFARRYLDGRRLSAQTISQFRIGYGPDNRDALMQYLIGAGFDEPTAIRAGLRIAGPDIKRPYDRFRNRIMFPITDLKGRVIAFGGRALDAAQPAKYLNSPETPLFHKGQVLFNAAMARKAAYDQSEIVAVEGYMDVIAMAAEGFKNTVAPLGTALTSEQLSMLWRMAPEPTLCFDGDAAGQKAALRAIDTALPHLKPGHSLKFAFLPDGQDPDDLLGNHGADALRSVLSAAAPLVDVLWQTETNSGNFTTPERRAALEAKIKTKLSPINDAAVKRHYEQDLKNRLWSLWRENGRKNTPGLAGQRGRHTRRFSGPKNANAQRRNGAPAYMQGTSMPGEAGAARGMRAMLARDTVRLVSREAAILMAILAHPWLMDRFDERIAELPFAAPQACKLRDDMLEIHSLQSGEDSGESGMAREGFERELMARGHDHLLSAVQKAVYGQEYRLLDQEASREKVLVFWQQITHLHEKRHALARDLAQAEQLVRADLTEENLHRLTEIRHQLDNCDKLVAGLEEVDINHMLD